MKLAGGGDLSEVDTTAFLEQAAEYDRAGDLRDSVIKLRMLSVAPTRCRSRGPPRCGSGSTMASTAGSSPATTRAGRTTGSASVRRTSRRPPSPTARRSPARRTRWSRCCAARRRRLGDVGDWVGAGANRVRDWMAQSQPPGGNGGGTGRRTAGAGVARTGGAPGGRRRRRRGWRRLRRARAGGRNGLAGCEAAPRLRPTIGVMSLTDASYAPERRRRPARHPGRPGAPGRIPGIAFDGFDHSQVDRSAEAVAELLRGAGLPEVRSSGPGANRP